MFEASVIAIRCHQELESPKHQINYFSKENLNLDRQVPALIVGLHFGGETETERFVLSFPRHLASKWSEMLTQWQQKWLVFKGGATCFREHLSQSHAQVEKHKMFILFRIKFGTISQLALVITHALLAALSALSMFSKRNVPMSIVTRPATGSVFP